ncbi:metallophosphoesterase [Fusibacter paucivorans]|uniref:Phosphoesterase n=1 Tax=Fusibacter paucivorans TaxID=76009 RepID=A0ABS5PL15_9FIRM|nr:metallophosphoesterase [Fusibacter paucivorans]MBS7525597.1 metallophosphoesterase [Fusibacter paucivorans]
MRVCIISDTHGNMSKVTHYLEENLNFFDEIWHLGDFIKDTEQLKQKFGRPMIAVKGNCDFYQSGPEEIVREIDGKRVLLCHGHHHSVKSSLMNLYYYAVQQNVDVVCFGHTHVPVNEREEGILCFNPGSAAIPRAGFRASIGIMEFGSGRVVATHVHL